MGQADIYRGSPGTADTSELPSGALWQPVDAELETPGKWNHVFVDFDQHGFDAPTTQAAFGNLKAFSSTGGLFTNINEEGGVIELGSDGDNEGSSVGMANFPFKISANLGELVFECRFKTTTIENTKHGILIGLMDTATLSSTVPIPAAPTEATPIDTTINFVGFNRWEGDGGNINNIYQANGVTAVTVKADAMSVVAGTYKKVGMVFNREKDNRLYFYDNGRVLPDSKLIPDNTGTDFPADVRLGFILAILNATASTPGSSYFDWVRVAQRRVAPPRF